MKIMFVMVKEDYIDPMNIELLSALAKQEGHETFLNVIEHNNLMEEIRSIRPDVVAYSAKTGESNVMFRANRTIKATYKDRIFTVMGGPHPTFNSMRMQLHGEHLKLPLTFAGPAMPRVVEDTQLDALVVGEGDDAWPSILRVLSTEGSLDEIPNVVTRTNRKPDGSVVLRERNMALDDLPYLDRDVVYAKTRLKDFGMRSLMAGRGCPFPCTYCFNAKYNAMYKGKGKMLNRYSVDRLIAELEDMIRRHRTQFIKFYDDVFVFRTDEWLIEFADKYPRAIGLPFHCLVRSDLVRRDPDILTYLKKAGIKSISMSIESGNPFIREQIFKRGMDAEDIRFAFELCHKHDIHTFSNTILAVPVPTIPDPAAPDFERKANDLCMHLESYHRMNLAALRNEVYLNGPLDAAARKKVVEYLEGLGLRHRVLDYDIESVDINIQNGVVFGEFPELHPYPGTPVSQYTIDVGAFDGDFEKLHQNYQTESPFTCFTPQEKLEQVNLSLLGLVLLVFPSWRNLVVNHLIKRRWTKLYFIMYYLAKAYLIGTKIYPMKYSARHILRTIRESFFSELLKHSREEGEKFYQMRKGLSQPPSEVLGGPWQS
ncbi:MAG: radical SAM protein [Nitrospirota bacterium]